ncbi:MAG: hypothetical protein RL591_2405, partial [Planctomycetota bacterium]
RLRFDGVDRRAAMDTAELAIFHARVESLDALEVVDDLPIGRGRNEHGERPWLVAFDVRRFRKQRICGIDELRELRDGHDEAREHPRLAGAAVAGVVRGGRWHVELRGREEPCVVENGIEKESNSVHSGSDVGGSPRRVGDYARSDGQALEGRFVLARAMVPQHAGRNARRGTRDRERETGNAGARYCAQAP